MAVKNSTPSNGVNHSTQIEISQEVVSNKESSRDTAAQTTRSFLASMDAETLSNATEQKYLSEYQEADRQMEAIRSEMTARGKVSKNTTEDGGVKFQFRGYAADGRGKYQGDYLIGTPKSAKSKDILKYIQNVWSKKPINLRIFENGKHKSILAYFDPTYDESKNIFNDATKLMGGNRHGSAKDQRVTLDLASDYYKIAEESTYNYSKEEVGKDHPAHKDVKTWHYFVNGIYFAEYGSEQYEPYMVTINVKEKADGNIVYSFNAEKERRLTIPGTLHAPVNNDITVEANGSPSGISILQSGEKSQDENGKNSLRGGAVTTRSLLASMDAEALSWLDENGYQNIICINKRYDL